MSHAPSLLTRHVVIEDVLSTWHGALGADATAYRGHVYRMFNFARALAARPAADDALAVAAAFHDLGIWSDETFDYLAPSERRANEYLAAYRPDLDANEITRLIALHHKLSRCPDTAGALAEAFRRADLVDLSLGAFAFGLPSSFVREARAVFPNAGFHRCLLRVGSRWAVRHPGRPLPMMRW